MMFDKPLTFKEQITNSVLYGIVCGCLLDKNFITQFDAGGTSAAMYVCTLSCLFSIAIMYFMVISMVDG